MYIQRNIEALSRKHFCCGKVVSFKHFECMFVYVCVCVWRSCLSYREGKAHASCYVVICGLCGCVIFFPHLINGTICEKKKKFAERKMRILIFSTNFFEAFLILRRIQRDIIINIQTSSCNVPVILVIF